MFMKNKHMINLFSLMEHEQTVFTLWHHTAALHGLYTIGSRINSFPSSNRTLSVTVDSLSRRYVSQQLIVTAYFNLLHTFNRSKTFGEKPRLDLWIEKINITLF